jgi:hypothetical protein
LDKGGVPRFLLLNRKRIWAPSEERWIGWERKRGKPLVDDGKAHHAILTLGGRQH